MPERINLGHVVAAVGAVVLFVSLFLDWWKPGVSAWNALELVDLLLAAIAAASVLAAAESFVRRPRPPLAADRWLPALGAVGLLLVLASIVNNPPAVQGRGEEAGAWIGLAGAITVAVGAFVAQRRISLVITSSPRETPAPEAHEPTGPALEPEGDESETRPMNPVGRG